MASENLIRVFLAKRVMKRVAMKNYVEIILEFLTEEPTHIVMKNKFLKRKIELSSQFREATEHPGAEYRRHAVNSQV